MCDYDVIQNNRRAFMEGDSWVFPTYYPLTAGILRNCTTPDFRKAHRKLNPSNLKCLTVVPRTTIMPQRVGVCYCHVKGDELLIFPSSYPPPASINRHQ